MLTVNGAAYILKWLFGGRRKNHSTERHAVSRSIIYVNVELLSPLISILTGRYWTKKGSIGRLLECIGIDNLFDDQLPLPLIDVNKSR